MSLVMSGLVTDRSERVDIKTGEMRRSIWVAQDRETAMVMLGSAGEFPQVGDEWSGPVRLWKRSDGSHAWVAQDDHAPARRV